MTPEAGKRAPFELLVFTAAPVAGALVVIELEGRFAAAPTQNGRFTRRPMLVVEPVDGRPCLELAPIRADLHDAYWRGAYAIPAEELTGARFSLGTRGTLLELPAPDTLDDTQRLASLASAEHDTAVLAARDGALAESAARIATLEAELAEARQTTAEEIAVAREQATARAEAADQRAAGAEARAQAAEKAAQAAAAGTDVLRAELAEERDRVSTAVTEPTVIAPVPAHGTPPHAPTHRGPGPWIAVAALVLFAVVLLGLLAGFLA